METPRIVLLRGRLSRRFAPFVAVIAGPASSRRSSLLLAGGDNFPAWMARWTCGGMPAILGGRSPKKLSAAVGGGCGGWSDSDWTGIAISRTLLAICCWDDERTVLFILFSGVELILPIILSPFVPLRKQPYTYLICNLLSMAVPAKRRGRIIFWNPAE